MQKATDADILRAIAKGEQAVTVGPVAEDLAETFEITKQGMHRRLDRLRLKGLVEKSIRGYVLTGQTRARIAHADALTAEPKVSAREREDEAYRRYVSRFGARVSPHES